MPNTESWLMPGSLPASEETDVIDAIRHINAGTIPPWLHPQARGIFGRPYRNLVTPNGDFLPGSPGSGGYVEYDVLPPVGVLKRGPRRIVQEIATGKLYYTDTHYGDSGLPSFWRIR